MTEDDDALPRKPARPFWIAAAIAWTVLLLLPVAGVHMAVPEDDKHLLLALPSLLALFAGGICIAIAVTRQVRPRSRSWRLLSGSLIFVLAVVAFLAATRVIDASS